MSNSSGFEITRENTFALRIIWAAIVLAQIVIHAVFWYARLGQDNPEPLAEPVLYIFVAIGTALPLIAPWVARLLARAGARAAAQTGTQRGVAAAFPVVIINLAVRESGGIFAAVALFLGAEPVLWAVPASVALGATLVAYPSVVAVRRLAQLGPETRRLA